MNDESNDRAVVILNEKPVKIGFKNYAAIEKQDIIDPKIPQDNPEGILLIINTLEKILREKGKDITDKFIEGVADEISVSTTDGWKNVFYVSLPQYEKLCHLENLPFKFPLTDTDQIFNRKLYRSFLKAVVALSSKELKTIRIIGIIKKEELDSLVASLKKMIKVEFKIELDSPYLVTVE